jgi:iron complex transport system permease protein
MTRTLIPYTLLLSLLALLCIALGAVSLLVGPGGGPAEIVAMLSRGDGDLAWMIVGDVRLPRTLLALFVGATLGMAGAALQGLLRNPLADPGVVGVTTSASLGAVIALYTGASMAFPLALPVMGIAGAFVSALILLALARRGGMLTLVLAGVAISSLCAALMSLALNLSPNPYAAAEIMFWLMGSVTDRSMDHVALSAPLMALGAIMLMLAARALNALSLGEETAASLGVSLARTRALVIGGASIGVGAGTAICGGIGFIGLVVPHLLRPMVGHTPGRLLPASALGGAALLMAADILVRLLPTGIELKLGVVTSLVGAPFFLWLIFRARTELES